MTTNTGYKVCRPTPISRKSCPMKNNPGKIRFKKYTCISKKLFVGYVGTSPFLTINGLIGANNQYDNRSIDAKNQEATS